MSATFNDSRRSYLPLSTRLSVDDVKSDATVSLHISNADIPQRICCNPTPIKDTLRAANTRSFKVCIQLHDIVCLENNTMSLTLHED